MAAAGVSENAYRLPHVSDQNPHTAQYSRVFSERMFNCFMKSDAYEARLWDFSAPSGRRGKLIEQALQTLGRNLDGVLLAG